MTEIKSATSEVLRRRSILTAYVDLGFGGSGAKSCALRLVPRPHDPSTVCGTPKTLSVGDLRKFLRSICTGDQPDAGDGREVLLVLEGPLSYRFVDDCPVGRGVDDIYGPAYRWHLQAANAARQAARLIIEDLFDIEAGERLKRCVYLAEGFVSGKSKKDERAFRTFARAKEIAATWFNLGSQVDELNPHLLDTAIMQLIHAGEIGEIFDSTHQLLKGCESVLARLSGDNSEMPPPVISVLDGHHRGDPN